MTLEELKTIIRNSNTITFARRLERASDDEIHKEILRGINEHIKRLFVPDDGEKPK